MQTKKYNYILQVEYIQYYKPTNGRVNKQVQL